VSRRTATAVGPPAAATGRRSGPPGQCPAQDPLTAPGRGDIGLPGLGRAEDGPADDRSESRRPGRRSGCRRRPPTRPRPPRGSSTPAGRNPASVNRSTTSRQAPTTRRADPAATVAAGGAPPSPSSRAGAGGRPPREPPRSSAAPGSGPRPGRGWTSDGSSWAITSPSAGGTPPAADSTRDFLRIRRPRGDVPQIGRVEGHPAIPLQAHLGPGMGIGAGHRVGVRAPPPVRSEPVAHRDPGRKAQGPRQHHEGGGVLFREPSCPVRPPKVRDSTA
jgi:hypothetical protein